MPCALFWKSPELCGVIGQCLKLQCLRLQCIGQTRLYGNTVLGVIARKLHIVQIHRLFSGGSYLLYQTLCGQCGRPSSSLSLLTLKGFPKSKTPTGAAVRHGLGPWPHCMS